MRNASSTVLSSLGLLMLVACGEDHTAGVAPATVTEPTPVVAPTAPVDPATRVSLPIDTATSTLGFTGAKVTGSHDGSFTRFSGAIELDRANLTASSVNVSIEIASMVIEPAQLSEHLLGADFFDAAANPTATFVSTAVTAGGTGSVANVPATHTISGDLTLHGRTQRITFPAVVELTDNGVRARAEFTINRRDFGIEYPGMPDDLIRDEVVIRFDVNAHG